MREFCLVNEAGTVINMCKKYDEGDPLVNDYQKEKNWKWVPISQVSEHRLRAYRYWNERP